MNVAGLVAAVDLKLVSSLIKALDARAPDLGVDKVHPADRYDPRPVIHPTPRYLPRRVLHPTARYLPRPVLHPQVKFKPAPAPESPGSKFNPTPWPFPPVWKTLPPVRPHAEAQVLKIAAPKIDILNKGTLVDLFI